MSRHLSKESNRLERERDGAEGPYLPLPVKSIVRSKENYKSPNRGLLGGEPYGLAPKISKQRLKVHSGLLKGLSIVLT
jgi:hypothetical protein